MQDTARSAAFVATRTASRAGFMSLAAAITFTVLGALGGLADQQFDAARLAQAGASGTAVAAAAAARPV